MGLLDPCLRRDEISLTQGSLPARGGGRDDDWFPACQGWELAKLMDA